MAVFQCYLKWKCIVQIKVKFSCFGRSTKTKKKCFSDSIKEKEEWKECWTILRRSNSEHAYKESAW